MRYVLVVILLTIAGCHEGDPADPCSFVTCSDHGECVDDGVAVTCECDPGYEADGFLCVEAVDDGDGGPEGDAESGDE